VGAVRQTRRGGMLVEKQDFSAICVRSRFSIPGQSLRNAAVALSPLCKYVISGLPLSTSNSRAIALRASRVMVSDNLASRSCGSADGSLPIRASRIGLTAAVRDFATSASTESSAADGTVIPEGTGLCQQGLLTSGFAGLSASG
jgi:hypothetical protein